MDKDTRSQQAYQWLQCIEHAAPASWTLASADASFRRYFRAIMDDDRSFILMDTPVEHENMGQFLYVASLLRGIGVSVPQVFSENRLQGFCLLEDLGTKTLQSVIEQQSADSALIDYLYKSALKALLPLQAMNRQSGLPYYDESLLFKELSYFTEWYVTTHCKKNLSEHDMSMLNGIFELIVKHNLNQSIVLVHRDYHCRNLMVSEDLRLTMIDFQDAVLGPITYDLVSLLKDAYVVWPEEKTIEWLQFYWELALKHKRPVPDDFNLFYEQYEWMGVQRHLKILGVFARLWHRDGKSSYLSSIPNVMHYLLTACGRYEPLFPLRDFLLNLQLNLHVSESE